MPQSIADYIQHPALFRASEVSHLLLRGNSWNNRRNLKKKCHQKDPPYINALINEPADSINSMLCQIGWQEGLSLLGIFIRSFTFTNLNDFSSKKKEGMPRCGLREIYGCQTWESPDNFPLSLVSDYDCVRMGNYEFFLINFWNQPNSLKLICIFEWLYFEPKSSISDWNKTQ